MKNQKQLRMGITTGTCAAAAAKAAALRLLLGILPENVPILTPKGIRAEVPVWLKQEEPDRVSCFVIKDSGDDPDVTNGAEIIVSVEKMPAGWPDSSPDQEKAALFFRDENCSWLYLDGGNGVGRVTKEGLEQSVGQAAINTVPRRMIFEAVAQVCEQAECHDPMLIVVHVPEGEELAERTFNPRLGIVGGISILGTSGILEPMSEKAIVDTIETQIRQLHALGEKKLLVTPGNYGQGYASDYLKLDMEHSIKCSNYIGETLDLAVSYGMKYFLLVGNIGKLVKLAAGIMNTHSRVADGRCEIMAVHAVLCGGDKKLAEQIMGCINTDEMIQLLEEQGLKSAVMESICRKIGENISRRGGRQIACGVILFSEKYGYLGQTPGAEKVLEIFRRDGTE